MNCFDFDLNVLNFFPSFDERKYSIGPVNDLATELLSAITQSHFDAVH